jgi:hypothetical protein
MAVSQTVGQSGSSCSACALISCLDKFFEGKAEPDIVRRMAEHGYPARCDNATHSFVVSATRTLLNVLARSYSEHVL